jgi:CysZ protein
MRSVSQFLGAVSDCTGAFGILFSPGFRRFMLYPLLVWVVIWVLTMYGIFLIASSIAGQVTSLMNPQTLSEYLPWFREAGPHLFTALTFLIKILIHLLLWMVSKTLVKYIVLIFLSPLFAILSEKTDSHLTGKDFPFSATRFVQDILRGVLISLRNMFFEYLIMACCFLASFIFPPLIVITVPFSLLASWFFTGFTLLDYNSERYRFTVRESVRFMKENKGLVCGIGCVYSVMLSLPFVIGSVIGMMFGPAIATIGATVAFLRIQQKEKIHQAGFRGY